MIYYTLAIIINFGKSCCSYNAVLWCSAGLATGNAVQLSAACTEDGVEVTWHASRSEVDLVQIEYICRNASADQNPDEVRMHVPVFVYFLTLLVLRMVILTILNKTVNVVLIGCKLCCHPAATCLQLAM